MAETREQMAARLIEDLVIALRALAYAAMTSGGTAGPDAALKDAIRWATDALQAYDAAGAAALLTVLSSSPGSGCEGQQGTGGSGSSEVSWREAVEAGWDDGVRFASEVLRSQVFPRDSARAACVDRVMAVIRLPSPIPPEAD